MTQGLGEDYDPGRPVPFEFKILGAVLTEKDIRVFTPTGFHLKQDGSYPIEVRAPSPKYIEIVRKLIEEKVGARPTEQSEFGLRYWSNGRAVTVDFLQTREALERSGFA